MTHGNDRWLDHTGRNLIRIVIGSYFLAISIDLVDGIDKGALFAGALPPDMAARAGSALLAGLSVIFMTGLLLRLSALMLALFVMCSSVMQTYVLMQVPGVSAFWRDMALVCAILLCSTSMRRRDVRKVRWFLRKGRGWIPRTGRKGTQVRPRRVALSATSARRGENSDYGRMLRPLIAPTGPISRPEPGGTARQALHSDGEKDESRAPPRPVLQLPETTDDDDGENIFANI